MWANREAFLAAALATAIVFLQGCGNAKPDLVQTLCADATAKAVESTNLVHEHLAEIQVACANETGHEEHEAVKMCEDEKIAGIDRAELNISTFYTEHCAEHVKEWLKGNETLWSIHSSVDKFETTHKEEIKEELHDGIHRGIEEGTLPEGEKTAFGIICTHAIEKEVHREGGLVHDHLEEVESGCTNKDTVLKCEEDGALGVVGAVGKIITKYTDHCKDAKTWSIHAVHPAVDNFATVHKDEIQATLLARTMDAMEPANDTGTVEEMITALCSDATAKAVESTDLMHEHLDEIEGMCRNETTDDAVKTCEDDKLAGIDAQEDNVSTFYTGHCKKHVDEDLKEGDKSFDLILKAVDKFKTDHTAEITTELHDALHRGIEEGKAGEKSPLEIVCTHEIEKEVEDAGLIHKHLKEIEDICKEKGDVGACEHAAATNIINAKASVISHYVEHCSDPISWTFVAIHPAVDSFAQVHKAEMKEALHTEIDNAMTGVGLKSATAAFLVPHAPVEASLPAGGAGALLALASAGLAAVGGAAGLGAARLARQRAQREMVMDHRHQHQESCEELLPNE